MPPAVGIVHQVNLEYLAKVRVPAATIDAGPVALPDTLVGTDSHTTMINGLGVVGWGVGGIEAEAVMLGQPLYMLLPEVVGFEADRRAARRRDGHRPGADRHADPAQGRRGRQVRRVLRPGRLDDDAGRSGHDRPTWRPNTARRWASSPSTTETLNYLRRTGRTEGRSRPGRALLRRSRACSAPTTAPTPTVHQGAAARPGDGRAEPGRPEAAAGPRAAGA